MHDAEDAADSSTAEAVVDATAAFFFRGISAVGVDCCDSAQRKKKPPLHPFDQKRVQKIEAVLLPNKGPKMAGKTAPSTRYLVPAGNSAPKPLTVCLEHFRVNLYSAQRNSNRAGPTAG